MPNIYHLYRCKDSAKFAFVYAQLVLVCDKWKEVDFE